MRESQRLNKLLTNFLDFARPRLPRFQWTEPVSVINAVAVLAQHAAISHNVELRQQMPGVCVKSRGRGADQASAVESDHHAVQATEGSGTVLIRSYVTQDKWCVEVCDEGRGVPQEDLDRIFDPFFTTKGEWHRLGLAVVRISLHSMADRPL